MKLLVWFALLVTVGCGAAPSGSPPATADTPAPRAAGAEEPAGARTLSAMDPKATLFAHVDGTKLRRTAFFLAYQQLSRLIPEVSETMSSLEQRCGFAPAQSVVELTAWSQLDARTKPHDFAMAVSLKQPARRGLECVAQIAKTSARGDEVELKAGVVARVADNVVLIGAPGAVKQAAERLSSRAAQPPEFAQRALSENPQAALLIGAELTTMPDRVPLRAGVVSLTSDSSHFALVTRLTLASAKHAQQLAQRLDASKLAAAVKQAQGDASVLPKARVNQRGAEVVHELRVDGDMEAQTAAVGALAAVAIHGVRRYIARSKEAEAKSTLRTIALSVAGYVERQPAGKRRLPPSAPRTPKDVPAGEKSMLTAQSFAHPTWKAIGFSLEGPHYYSYEIVTAPGGRQAAIIATGDLDGDGELSRYRLELKIDARGNLNMAPQLSVERELE